MPTDTDLRALFRQADVPASAIDPSVIIRRSKRRRLPQQIGAGSALTLAVAGISVASIQGIRGAAPMTASDQAGNAPTSATDDAPYVGAESTAPQKQIRCEPGGPETADTEAPLEAGLGFPATAAAGQSVAGSITVTNTGSAPVTGTVTGPSVSLSGNGTQLTHTDISADATPVMLGAGDSITIAFTFDAVGCEPGVQPDTPLAAGDYELAARLTFQPEHGPATVVGGPASVIAVH